MAQPQSFKHHTRYDPLFHFTVLPLLLLNFAFMIYITVHNWPEYKHTHLWMIVMAVVLFLIAGVARSSALRAQDRIIRLEERLRFAALLPQVELHAAHALTLRQIIALRFASDAELPGLVKRTLKEGLDPKAIKANITTWRADDHRV